MTDGCSNLMSLVISLEPHMFNDYCQLQNSDNLTWLLEHSYRIHLPGSSRSLLSDRFWCPKYIACVTRQRMITQVIRLLHWILQLMWVIVKMKLVQWCSSFESMRNEALHGMWQNLTKEQAEYCTSRMKSYQDSSGRTVLDAYDYVTFTNDLFIN